MDDLENDFLKTIRPRSIGRDGAKEVAVIGRNLDYIALVRGAEGQAAYPEGHALNELTALCADEEQNGSEKTAIGPGFSLGDNRWFQAQDRNRQAACSGSGFALAISLPAGGALQNAAGVKDANHGVVQNSSM